MFPGETIGLVGESGCGKSVTSLSVLRLLNPSLTTIQGQIRFAGKNLLDMTAEKMRQIRGGTISMIFQEPMTSLNPILTVGEQIAESLRLHENLDNKKAWKKAVSMLEIVQIPSPETRAGQYPHKLSGGMRQRAMIAMALACNPRLIFADEPTTALDVTIQAQIIRLLEHLKQGSNTSIVLITHDLGVVAQMASRVVVMYAGKVVEEAPVVELFHDARHPYTKGLLNSIPVITRDKKNGSTKYPAPSPTFCGCRKDAVSTPGATRQWRSAGNSVLPWFSLTCRGGRPAGKYLLNITENPFPFPSRNSILWLPGEKTDHACFRG